MRSHAGFAPPDSSHATGMTCVAALVRYFGVREPLLFGTACAAL